jgi:hypothetical protein
MRAMPHPDQRPGLQGSSLKVHSAQYFVVMKMIEHQIIYFLISLHTDLLVANSYNIV